MILLTFRDLSYRVVRFVVVTLLGAVVFSLLFVMTGLVEQFNQEPYLATEAMGASAWVLPEGVSGPFTATPSLPADSVAATDADRVAPVVVARSSLVDGSLSEEIVLIGHEPDGLGAPPVSDGRGVSGAGEAVVDDTVDVSIGDDVEVGGRTFTVVGRSSDMTILAGIPFVFVSTSEAQDLVFRSGDVISAVLVDGQVRSVPDGTVAIPVDDVAQDTLNPLDGAIASIDLVRALLWVVAAIIIGAVVYLSALERQRDFAVLKAVGVSNRQLLGSLAVQAVLVALVSVALAAVIQMFLAPAFPLVVRVPARAFWQLPVFAVVMALVAGAAGMRRVARSDPALAFAGAGG
jgi:putative ABC transport system permease protein